VKLPPEFYTMFARAFFSQLMKRYGGVIFRRLFVSIPVAAAQKTQSFLPLLWRHA
jgi:hypothetical protein